MNAPAKFDLPHDPDAGFVTTYYDAGDGLAFAVSRAADLYAGVSARWHGRACEVQIDFGEKWLVPDDVGTGCVRFYRQSPFSELEDVTRVLRAVVQLPRESPWRKWHGLVEEGVGFVMFVRAGNADLKALAGVDA